MTFPRGIMSPCGIRSRFGALFGLLVGPPCFVSNRHAQINGTPASVTSPGFGGQAVNGPRASVTSVGPQGYAPSSRESVSGEFHNTASFTTASSQWREESPTAPW